MNHDAYSRLIDYFRANIAELKQLASNELTTIYSIASNHSDMPADKFRCRRMMYKLARECMKNCLQNSCSGRPVDHLGFSTVFVPNSTVEMISTADIKVPIH
jgi:hypothetical protein